MEVSEEPKAVVGIGGSAGGLDAVKVLLQALPERPEMAFIVILHSEPTHSTSLAEILRPVTKMEVEVIQDGARIKPNHTYVAPSDKDVMVEGKVLRLIPRALTHRIHMPIDTFLCSLAQSYGSNAIAVILSGSGSDGTLGLKDIKAKEGTVFAQDEKSAKYHAMPKSAILAGYVDQILPPSQIAAELGRLGTSENSLAQAIPQSDIKATREIIACLRGRFGVDFGEYKQTTISRRLLKRLAATKTKSLSQYLGFIKVHHEELEALYKDILINVTSFFRDPEMFDALGAIVFPKILEGRSSEEAIRVWVPGCSSGEEVYSIAISLMKYNEKIGGSYPLQIFGTDISEPALEKARTGLYPQAISSVVPENLLREFFDPVTQGYQVKKSLRDLCVFARQNVVADPPLSKMDLISCRNVLIYLGPALQERVVPTFHYALKPLNGFLVLGKSEIVDIFSDYFVPVDKTHKFYVKKDIPQRLPLHQVAGQRIPIKTDATKVPAGAPKRDAEIDVQKEADRLILATFSPASVVVTENMDIIQFRGDTAPFLQPLGRASFNLFKMLHADLLQPIRHAVDQAKTKNARSVRCNQLRLRQGEEFTYANARVMPIKSRSLTNRYFLITFERAPSRGGKLSLSKEVTRTEEGTEISHVNEGDEVRRLSDELEDTRQHLQSVVDEREITVEELQSANEEVTSSNEELQTINQELETAKEELESSNEELTTLNEQLRQSMEQLRISEERFRHLVSGVKDYAIFMLDKAGYILSWNEGAERLKGYSEQEIIGKHFSVFYPEEDKKSGKPEKELEIATATGRYEEEGIRIRKDGSTFYANVLITALKGPDGKVYGFAKVTRDITDRKQAERELRAAKEDLEVKVRDRTQKLQQYAEELKASNSELEQFAFIASHDLQEPLRMVSTYLQYLEHQLTSKLEPEDKQYIDYAVSGAQRMQALIEDLLTFSRVGREVKNEPVDLNVSVREALENLKSRIDQSEAKITSGELPMVYGDPVQMVQLFQNLISNGIKYRGEKLPEIEIGAKKESDRWLVSVRDNGIGIEPQYRERIFEVFKRLHSDREKYPGTGIGLAICKKIVEKHGGRIWVESKGNEGSTFLFTLPIRENLNSRK